MTNKDRQDYHKFRAEKAKIENSNKPQPKFNQPSIPPPPLGYPPHSALYQMQPPPQQMPYIPNHPMMGAPKYPSNKPTKYAHMQ